MLLLPTSYYFASLVAYSVFHLLLLSRLGVFFSSKRDLEECTCVIKLLGTNNSVGFLVTL